MMYYSYSTRYTVLKSYVNSEKKKNIVTVFVFPNLFPLFQFVAIKVVKKQSQEQVEHHKVSHYKCWDEDCEAGPWGALQHKITNNRTTIAKLTALV